MKLLCSLNLFPFKTLSAPGRVTTIMRKRDLPIIKQIQDLTNDHKKIDFKYTSNAIRKVIRMEKWKMIYEKLKTKVKSRSWKRRLGLPVARGVGSPENKVLVFPY